MLGDAKCSATARGLIEDEDNEKWISPASHWELAIKIRLGKYSLPVPFEQFLEKAVIDNGFLVLPIEPHHTGLLTTMPFHHRDPLDRLMIAQAKSEQMDVVSSDAQWDAYTISRHWF